MSVGHTDLQGSSRLTVLEIRTSSKVQLKEIKTLKHVPLKRVAGGQDTGSARPGEGPAQRRSVAWQIWIQLTSA